MNNPWADIDFAYAPMFLDVVEVSGVRKNNAKFKTTCKACTFPVEKCEPFNDTLEDSELMKISVYIAKKSTDLDGWSMDFKPQIGDQMKMTDDTVWKISTVKETQNWYEIEGRSGK